MAYRPIVIVYVALYIVTFVCVYCLVSDSRQNTMIRYEQANVNADCSVGLISKLLRFCVCVHIQY